MTKQATTAALLWTAILGATAVFGSYAFACVFPFAAVATIAALTLDARRATALVAAVFVVNQIVGFAVNHYPLQTGTYAWGGFIALAAFMALGAAILVRGNAALLTLRTPVALVAAIAAYQAVMFVGAVALDGFASSSPEIVAKIALNDVVWFAGLAALRLVLTRVMPTVFEPTTALAHA